MPNCRKSECDKDLNFYGQEYNYCSKCCIHKNCNVNVDYSIIFELSCKDCCYTLDLIEIINDDYPYGKQLINTLGNKFNKGSVAKMSINT